MTDFDKRDQSTATLTSTGTSQSDEDVDEVLAGDNFQTLGWKVVLLLQFQPQFVAVMMIGTYISYICSVMDVAFAFAAPSDKVPHTYSPMGVGVIFSFDLVYALDILLTVMYKNTQWTEMQHLFEERHALMVVLDVISVIPLDPMYHSLTEANMKVISIIRLRYTLRIFRFLARIGRMKDTIGINHVLAELLDFLITFSLTIVTVSCIGYLMDCESKCEYHDPKIIKSFYIMARKITSRGYPIATPSDLKTYFLHIITNLCSFVYIYGFVVGFFLIAALQQIKSKNLYQNMHNLIVTKMRKTNVNDDLLFKTTDVFFNLFWKCRKGVKFNNIQVHIVPEIIGKEINLDISWDAFKHSHLFRDKEVHFLRFAAPYMKQKFMIPGETIYKRNQFKSSMVYVATGVVQILSEEDGETPIISFSGGTCIGESTLFLDYPSTCSVVCKSYCELYVLDRKDFLKILFKYPEECKRMLNTIRNRYKEAKYYQELLDFAYDDTKQKREIIVMKWMKATLQDLTVKGTPASDDEKIFLGLEERELLNEFDKLVFCCYYLDMLVITEQIELVTDTVFLRTSCPCILQPDSFIVNTWNDLIVLAVLIFGFVYPYYASFQPKTPNIYLIFSYIISVLWVLDVYINLSTGVRTRNGIISEVRQIVFHKFQTPELIMDVLAAIPLELLALFVAGYPSSQTFVLLQAPRLLKIYRIGRFFDECLTIFNVITRTYLKYMVYMLLLTYYIAAMLYLHLCYELVCDTNNIFLNFIKKITKGSIKDILIMCTYFAVQQMTSIGLQAQAPGVLDALFVPIIITELITTLFYINLVSNIAATDALKRFDALKLREYTANVLTEMQNVTASPRLCKDVVLHIRGQFEYNAGADILYSPVILGNRYFHPFLVREVRRLAFLKGMARIPLFAGWPNELLGNLAAVAFINILVPGKVITYSGEVCKEMHILLEGFCEMYRSSEEVPKTISPGYSISVVELCCGIPVVNHVATLTHCRLCTFKYEQFMQELQSYPELLIDLKITASDTMEAVNLEDFTDVKTRDLRQQSARSRSYEDISFKHFGYKLDLDTKEGKDFHQYFDKLGFFNCLRYVFMRHTITSYGRFIRYWEIFRCIFAFITSMLTPVPFLSTCADCHWIYILTFLDLTAWLDIFVRHHICYFDAKGIEITHPLKTAIHYWKHCFLIDLLGVLPFEILLEPLFKTKLEVRQKVFLRMTRILQFHRVIGGIRYINTNSLSPSHTWAIIKFVPVVLLIINVSGAVIINLRCDFESTIAATEKFTAGVYCQSNTWLSESEVTKPLNPLRTHMYGLFIVTVAITGPGLGGFAVQNSSEAFRVIISTLIGCWMFVYIAVRVISDNLFRNVDFTSYQEAMHNLVKFLSYRRIDAKLKNEVIEHFEHVWCKKKGKDLHQTITNFNYALQEDILLDVYGKVMKESAVFSRANDSFFRSLLLNVKHEFFMKQGIITQVNNVHGKIFFTFKGQVEVLGPDYSRLLILPVGSLFGNIDDCRRSRQTLTMVAKGHVEVLTIKTTTFYHILSNYHSLNIEFRKLTSINTDYLLGAPPPPIYGQSLILKSHITVASFKYESKTASFMKNFKHFYAVFIWEYVVLVLVCYIGFILELYHLTVREQSKISIIMLYFLDSLFIINIILQFQTAYEDEFGVLITDKKQIARRYCKDHLGFPLQLASVIPFEAFAFFFINSKRTWTVWNYCRCNRLIRVCFVADYFRRKNQQLNINVNVMRTLSILVWIYLFLQVLTSLLITASCTNPEYNIRPVTHCNWTTMTTREKFDTYAYQFSVVLYIFTMTSIAEYFPNSPLLCILVIFLLIGSRFLVIHVVAEITATLNIILKKRTLYEEHVDKIREHIVRERISPALLERVWLYVRVLWKIKGGLQFPVLLLDAPYYLREGVLNSMFGCHLRRHELFRLCHVDLLRQIAAQMRTRTFFTGDYITFINDADERMYFIHEGAVDALSEDDLYEERIDKTLYKGEIFGLEQGLYSQIGHEYSYRANRHTVILVLERKTWIHLLDFFPASRRLVLRKKPMKNSEKCN